MGITVASLHVYSDEPMEPALGRFVPFSPGWQTLQPGEIKPEDDLYAVARKLSKKVVAPVLVFHMFDSDELSFSIFESGRTAAYYSTFGYEAKKGIFKIPGLVGYPDGHKRRISEILSCGDVELLADLLEEFFGVALMVFEDDDPATLIRSRGDKQYRAFHEQEQQLRGKRAPIQAKLVDEFPGKISRVCGDFGHDMTLTRGFLFGMEKPGDREEDMRPMMFVQGKLVPIPEEQLELRPATVDSPLFDISLHLKKFTCSNLCPEPFRGRTYKLPPGFFPEGFDHRQRLIISTLRGVVAFMDQEGKIIARLSLTGGFIDAADGYLLTASASTEWLWMEDPKARLHVYRIEDQ